MSYKEKVYLAGVGMITPVGANAEMTTAAVRAGASRLQESEYYSKKGKPFTMAMVPEEVLPEITCNLDREEGATLQMGVMLMTIDVALKQVMQSYPGDGPIPLFFSGPESYQNGPYSVSPNFIEYVIKQTNVKIDKSNSRLLALGRAGVIEAIDLAVRYLQQTKADYALIGGADSYQDGELLEYLDIDDRVKAEGVMNGFVPGEAAGFLLLTKDINKAMRQNHGVISLSKPGVAQEKGHLYSNEPYRGDGLSEAFNLALDGNSSKKISKIYSSLNGEQYWVKEYSVAVMRSKNYFANDISLEHPADCFGDTGAAVGALLVGIAATDLVIKGVNNTSLVTCSSDQAYRAAMCVNFERLE